MANASDLGRLARKLTVRIQGLRHEVVALKQNISTAALEIDDTAREVQDSRRRLDEITAILENLRDTQAEAKCEEDAQEAANQLTEWEDEHDDEAEHMEFLTQEHSEMVAHRKRLLVSLIGLARKLMQARRRQQLVRAIALRLGMLRLTSIKQVQ